MGEIAGWVRAEHVSHLVQHVAAYVGTRWDDTDQMTIERLLPGTDAEQAGGWFDYPLAGEPDLVLRIANDVGTDVVLVRIEGDIGEVLAARLETLLDVL